MNIRRQSSSARGRIARLTVSTALMACVTQAYPAISMGNTSADAIANNGYVTPELVLVIWDSVKEISYTKDLGISVYKDLYASGNTSTNLFVYGQQESFYQQLTTLNSDAKFLSFLNASTDIANQRWAVFGVSQDEIALSENGATIYTTVRHATATGTEDVDYIRLKNATNQMASDAAGQVADFIMKANVDGGACSTEACQTNYANNSSYLSAKGQNGYPTNFSAGRLPGSPNAPFVFSAINQSSWFYALTVTSELSDNVAAVDEFDNLGHDAYWGLGVNAQGEYILSYTMQASLTQAQTLQGQMLRLRTDFAANYGNTRFIGAPVGDTLNLGGGAAITPVPEPSTWGLMGLGLALLAGRARRQKNA